MIKYMKWILPAIFIAYYGTVSLFTHIHIENGVAIVHSHTFDDTTNGAAHEHASLYEIQLFHTLSSLSIEDGAVHALQLQFQAQQITEIEEQSVCPDYTQPVKGLHALRAPPFSFCF